MKQTLFKTLSDLFSKEIVLFVCIAALGALILAAVPMWIFWEEWLGFVTSYLQWIPWEWLQTTGASIGALGLGYMAFIVLINVFTSLFSETLLIRVAKKHYPDVSATGEASIAALIAVNLKASVIFLALFVLCIPVLFIPVLGQLVMLYLWSVLIKEPTVYEVGSLFVHDTQLRKEKNKKAATIALIASLFNYIPLLNIFAPIFAQILFLHYILRTDR